MFILNRGNPDTNRGTSFIEFGPRKETFGASPPDFEVRVKFEETARLLVSKGYSPVNDAAKALVKAKPAPVAKEAETDSPDKEEVGEADEAEEKPKRTLPKPNKK